MLIGIGYAISVVSTLAVVPVYTADRSQEATALGFMCAEGEVCDTVLDPRTGQGGNLEGA